MTGPWRAEGSVGVGWRVAKYLAGGVEAGSLTYWGLTEPEAIAVQDALNIRSPRLPNVERAITDLLQIREAAASMGDPGHDIATWASDALQALGYHA